MAKIVKKYHYLFTGAMLVLIGCYMPTVFDFIWVNMIVDIRKSIVSGDSGHLVLTAFIWSAIIMVQKVLLFNGILLIVEQYIKKIRVFSWIFIGVHLFNFTIVLNIVNQYTYLHVEFLTSLLSGFVSLVMIGYLSKNDFRIRRNMVISMQVFFAFQWLNLIPGLSSYSFGVTDVPSSIKVAVVYLGSVSVLNFIGFAFFMTLIISSIMTFRLFTTYERHMAVAKENYEKELALDSIRQKAIQNRVYEEIHAITHDLKTPLVTIRGLNSLISMSKEQEKVKEYTERIDNAVTKMTEMISGFLYESSKQIISTEAIIDYVRAQIPIEDELLKIDFEFEADLPVLYVNKIRVSRALINILENAIIVPTKFPVKEIKVTLYSINRGLVIEVKDNGVGIPKSQMNKIWEIGYSTKQTTGLGLAFVKKVIEDNGGTITINSMINRGTTVKILLPNITEVGEEEI